jgi:hypothetical protein
VNGRSPAVTVKLWGGILAGPAAWAVDLTATYALVHRACRTQDALPLHGIACCALVVIALGAASAWRGLQFSNAEAVNGAPVRSLHRDRERFMAQLGLVMCAVFAIAVIAGAFPQWMIDACP